jgi:hypothetical protein
MGLPSSSSPSTVTTIPTSGYYWATGKIKSGPFAGQANWVIRTTPAVGLCINSNRPVSYQYKYVSLYLRNYSKINFRKNKTYQISLELNRTMGSGISFSINTPWSTGMDYNTKNRYGETCSTLPVGPAIYLSNTSNNLFFYSSPNDDILTNDAIIIKANGYITTNAQTITKVYLREIDFSIQGFAFYRDNNSGTSSTSLNLSNTDGCGWCYYADTNSYVWYDNISNPIRPVINLVSASGDNYVMASYSVTSPPSGVNPSFMKVNCLYKFISESTFNLSFTYTKLSGNTHEGISIYLSQEPPSNNYEQVASGNFIPSDAILLSSYTQSGSTYSAYFGLSGNQYLIITASFSTSTNIISLTNVDISSGYWSGNNRNYVTIDGSNYSEPLEIYPNLQNATFSAYTGTGNTYNATSSLDVQKISSKIGNGKFMAGIWENGVWNSGMRDDENAYEFYSIGVFFHYNQGKNWRFQIIGPESSVSNFEVGDKISIGNIVAIDFNGERKLLKGYYTIFSKSTNFIIVEIINNFPLQKIEKDSENHRILITKNVWLSGVFLNGYFKGVWNNGLFKGYPLLTEMFDSHWVDGTFDGGHFQNRQYSATFSDTFFVKGKKVGLTFSTPHKLNVGDVIQIDKDDKDINPSYDGIYNVTSVPDEYSIVTDIDFENNYTGFESGAIYSNISTGLIQNFQFKSNNISKLSSADYLDSDAVFLYNSWIDVNFNTYSAVNIGRPNTIRNNFSGKEFAQNNLYGYTTDDILSSDSVFRNSFNLKEKSYKLGTKYKIYNDYIGKSSEFDTFFDPTNINPTEFLNLGWTYSGSNIIFSRSGETRSKKTTRPGYSPWINVREDLLVGSELQIDSRYSGGVLNASDAIEEVDFKTTTTLRKERYTMVEFDLVRWSAPSEWYQSNDSKMYIGQSKEDPLTEPIIHFDNLNSIVRDIDYGIYGTYPTTIQATYLPIYQNINHLTTPVKKKVEYFYNKTNLSLNFRGSGFNGSTTASILLDNLKYYEVDMIPFFQYFTKKNINTGISVPYQGIAPFIDYSNANFDFVDNVPIGFDSFAVNASNVAVFGVGVGIGSGYVDIYSTGVAVNNTNFFFD